MRVELTDSSLALHAIEVEIESIDKVIMELEQRKAALQLTAHKILTHMVTVSNVKLRCYTEGAQ